MKKTVLTLLAVMLMMTLCASAFALTGDLTIKAAKAYADPDFVNYIGTIPKYSSVLVRAYGSYADIIYNGIECYVKPSTLDQGAHEYSYVGTGTIKKGAKVYQRPSSAARSVTMSKARTVKVYALSKGYVLVRYEGVYGFVAADDLTNLKS